MLGGAGLYVISISLGQFQDLELANELLMVRTNIEAVVHLCGEYVPAMIERGRGAVMNVASTAAFQPLARQATYSASNVVSHPS